jgi:hypothetical protein
MTVHTFLPQPKRPDIMGVDTMPSEQSLVRRLAPRQAPAMSRECHFLTM